MRVLVTGGAGYIGMHCALALMAEGYDVLIADNFSNSSPEGIRRLGELASRSFDFELCDLRDAEATEGLFARYDVDAVMHFAGLKAVGESGEKPLLYYDNNLRTTLNLLSAMQRNGVKRFVFSSSATVYADMHGKPIRETDPLKPGNPYGRTKLMQEEILRDAAAADPALSVALLRYFNPLGAHESGRIGEAPNGIPNNLVPYIAQVACGKRKALRVFGNDYDTPDGTGIRDYIHVTDLAEGHLDALKELEGNGPGVRAVNLGSGRGYSVMEVLHAFEQACGRTLPYEIAPRRAGDFAISLADPSYALKLYGWQAKRGMDEMCRDTWRWQKNNPDGFTEA